MDWYDFLAPAVGTLFLAALLYRWFQEPKPFYPVPSMRRLRVSLEERFHLAIGHTVKEVQRDSSGRLARIMVEQLRELTDAMATTAIAEEMARMNGCYRRATIRKGQLKRLEHLERGVRISIERHDLLRGIERGMSAGHQGYDLVPKWQDTPNYQQWTLARSRDNETVSA